MTMMSLTCDLGLDLALHLQRIHKDAAVADETGAGDASVGLTESFFVKIIPETQGCQRYCCSTNKDREVAASLLLSGLK